MKKIIIIGAALAVCLAAAILHHTSQPKFESLSAGDFSDLLDSADVQIVDVRTAAEHDAGHIPGTDCNIDVKGESFVFQSRMLLSKDRPVALYCRSGNRSKTAAELLAKEGYEVYELSSGFNGWMEAGHAAADSLIVIDSSHEGLTIYYPQYDSINLECQSDSPENDKEAIFACAAAFTDKTGNVMGDYVSNGTLHTGGYSSYGCFVWYDGKWEFTTSEDAPAAIKRAQDGKGMGFRQLRLIHDGKKIGNKTQGEWIFRALCEKDGVLCIAQSSRPMCITDFINLMHKAGIQYAIYLDMGGWNHSWYRKWENSKVTYIFKSSHDSYSNWLTFYTAH